MIVVFQVFRQRWKFTIEDLSSHTTCQQYRFHGWTQILWFKSLHWCVYSEVMWNNSWTWFISKASDAAEEARQVTAWKVQTQQLDKLISSSQSLSFEAHSNMLSVLQSLWSKWDGCVFQSAFSPVLTLCYGVSGVSKRWAHSFLSMTHVLGMVLTVSEALGNYTNTNSNHRTVCAG